MYLIKVSSKIKSPAYVSTSRSTWNTKILFFSLVETSFSCLDDGVNWLCLITQSSCQGSMGDQSIVRPCPTSYSPARVASSCILHSMEIELPIS